MEIFNLHENFQKAPPNISLVYLYVMNTVNSAKVKGNSFHGL